MAIQSWTVQLRSDHPGYTQVKLKRGLPNDKNYTVVVVASDKLMECYGRERPGYILPPVQEWKDGKEEGIRQFLNPATGIPEMARISFETRERKRLFGILKPVREGVVAFINGRHRTIYMAYAGATQFPVEVHVSDAGALREYCGSK